MTTIDLHRYRHCPACGSNRPEAEWTCQNEVEGEKCLWPLADQPVQVNEHEQVPSSGEATDGGKVCTNGHPMTADMEICFVCGADAAPAEGVEEAIGQAAESSSPIEESDAGPVPSIDGFSDLVALPRSPA